MRDHRQREDNGGEYCNRLDVRDISVHGDGAAERDTFDVVLSCTGCVPARGKSCIYTLRACLLAGCASAGAPAVGLAVRYLFAYSIFVNFLNL